MRKRSCGWLLGVVWLLILSGCGGGGDGGASGPDPGSPGNDSPAPMLLAASLGGSVNGALSVFQGQEVADAVAVVTEAERAELAFTLTSGPAGSSIDQDGMFHYSVPTDLAPGTTLPVKIKVNHAGTGESISLEEALYVMERKVVGAATLGTSGGEVSDEWGEIVVSVPAGAVPTQATIKIIRGRDAHGNVVVTFQADGAVNDLVEVRLADPELVLLNETAAFPQATPATAQPRATATLTASATLQEPVVLLENLGWFWNPRYDPWKTAGIGNRVRDPSKIKISLTGLLDGSNYLTETVASRLISYRNQSDLWNKVPVLLIHGYTPTAPLLSAGGVDTWGNLPEKIQNEIDSRFAVFEFQWITAARFEDVAAELGMAVYRLNKLTGNQVHVIAHSFGGILTRTLLQGMATNFPYPSDVDKRKVASVITVGTPHGGIFAADTVRGGKTFPKGWDSLLFLGCGQVSCYQMGVNVPFVNIEKEVLQLPKEYGSFLAELSSKPLPELPFRVLIGLTTSRDDKAKLDGGDGLISFAGQRIRAGDGDSDPLHTDGNITETVLGFGLAKPGDPIILKPDLGFEAAKKGYRHSPSKLVQPDDATPMVYVTSPEHHTFYEIKEWLAKKGAPGSVSTEPEVTLSLTVKDGITGASLSGAQALIKVNNSPAGSGITDSTGQAWIKAPFFPNQTYTVITSLSGFRAKQGAFTTKSTAAETSSFWGTVLLLPPSALAVKCPACGYEFYALSEASHVQCPACSYQFGTLYKILFPQLQGLWDKYFTYGPSYDYSHQINIYKGIEILNSYQTVGYKSYNATIAFAMAVDNWSSCNISSIAKGSAELINNYQVKFTLSEPLLEKQIACYGKTFTIYGQADGSSFLIPLVKNGESITWLKDDSCVYRETLANGSKVCLVEGTVYEKR